MTDKPNEKNSEHNSHNHTLPHNDSCCDSHKIETPSNSIITRYRIDNLCCPTEEALIRQRLDKENYIYELAFQILDKTLTVTHKAKSEIRITNALTEIGFKPTPFENKSELPDSHSMSKRKIVLLTLSGFTAITAEALHFLNEGNQIWVILLSSIAILSAGIPTYIKGWQAISQFNLNINALMSVAVTGAVLIEQWPEAAMVMFLFAIAEQLEGLSLGRARNAINELMSLTPETAEVLIDGHWLTKSAKEIAIDDTIRIKPGDLIPLDGTVLKGNSSVNQAAITGESIAVEKTCGHKVFAGTLNENGLLEVSVQSTASHSTLAKIIRVVEESQGKKAPTQRFVDKFAKVYTPVVFLIALLTAIMPPLLFDQEWFTWIYKALVILVIACPCALVISTPVSIVSGLAAAARKGILVKGGEFLEGAHLVTEIALDKTGTLTQGKPTINAVDIFNGISHSEALQIAASLASLSTHPISQSISNFVKENHTLTLSEVENYQNITGQGLKGYINKTPYYLGNRRLLDTLSIEDKDAEKRIESLEQAGNTVTFLSNTTEIIAIIAVSDPIKTSSRQAIQTLKDRGINCTMLTGDNAITANAIGLKVGIDNIQTNLLPEQKLKYVEQAIKKGEIIAMVGDGINDAPAMAKSHIAIAMGATGSDTALETADIALMDDDLNKIIILLTLSKKTSTILKQNIFFALSIKSIFLALTFSGDATLWMAVFADMGTSFLVIFNGLRLVRA